MPVKPAWLAVAGALGLGAASAGAGPYDGVYVANPGTGADFSACAAVPILIAGDRITYFDVDCALANPVQIRAMDGVLYDGECRLDGTRKAGRVLLRRMESGDLALVTPFMDVRVSPCEVAG